MDLFVTVIQRSAVIDIRLAYDRRGAGEQQRLGRIARVGLVRAGDAVLIVEAITRRNGGAEVEEIWICPAAVELVDFSLGENPNADSITVRGSVAAVPMSASLAAVFNIDAENRRLVAPAIGI